MKTVHKIIIIQESNKYLVQYIKHNITSMYTGYKVNTSVNKSVTSALNETQLQSLQRQVDNYTRKLEQQKRKFFNIQDTFKSVSEEYEKEKNKLNELKKENTKAHNVMFQAKIKNLQANLEKAISTYDDTVAFNNKLKSDIDMLRRQKKNYIQMHKSLEEQIGKLELQSSEKLELIEKKKIRAQQLKRQIMQIKLKNEEERQAYMKQFDTLQKQYMKGKRQRSQSNTHEKVPQPEAIDTQPLLKHRLKKILASNKEKMKMIQQYKKHMKAIQQAFSDIKEKSGIQDLTQITNTFIKSEQQNYSLYNYMDMLSQNVDQLQEANRQLEEKIKQQSSQIEKKKQIMMGTPEQQRQKQQLQKYIKQKEETSKQLNELIDGIRPTIQSTLLELTKSQFNDNPKKLQDYELGFNITDRTIQQYLSDIQKYINAILFAKQEAKTKVVNSLKQQTTSYTRIAPSITTEDVREKAIVDIKQDNKFMDTSKFREYASQYWKKKNKARE